MTTATLPGSVRHLAALRRDQTGFFARLAATHGDVVHLRIGPEPTWFFAHPDAVRDVLVAKSRSFRKGRGLERSKWLLGEGLLTSEAGHHLRQRRLVQPAFHRDRIARYAEAMVAAAAARSDAWRDGATVQMAAEMHALTLDVVARTLFSAEVGDRAAAVGDALGTVFSAFRPMLLPGAGVLVRTPLPWARRLRDAKQRLDDTVYEIIAGRRADPRDHGDLLSMLLLAQDAEALPGTAARMTDEQVHDEVLTLFLAGHETTANALTWAWWLLSGHPEAAAALRSELDAALGDRPPSFADLPALGAAERVFAEAMRLYPPAWIQGRRAVEDVEIAGVAVPAGSLVLVSQWVTHRDPRWWPDPERFDPGRWQDDGAAALRPRFAYFPFGGGNRVCVGESFAWTEGVLLLASLASRWDPVYAGSAPPSLEPGITLRAGGGVPMTLRRRREMP